MVLRRLLSCLRGERTVSVNPTKLSNGEVADALHEAVPNYKDGVKRPPFDGTYWAPTREQFERVVNEDLTNLSWYKKNKYDCEDFAGSLMFGLRREYGISSIGVVVDHSAGHAYNVVVFADGEVRLTPNPESDSKYQLSNGIIWL